MVKMSDALWQQIPQTASDLRAKCSGARKITRLTSRMDLTTDIFDKGMITEWLKYRLPLKMDHEIQQDGIRDLPGRCENAILDGEALLEGKQLKR
jgi:hypothetical protein